MRFLLPLIFLLGCGDDDLMEDAGTDLADGVTADSAEPGDVGPSPDDVGPGPGDVGPGPGDAGQSEDSGTDAGSTCISMLAEGTQTRSISGAAEGSYELHVPTGFTGGSAPLVLDFHGYTESPDRQNGRSGFRAKADAEGFVLVQPQGDANSWNAGVCCGRSGRDDVAFMRAIIEDLSEEACIDRSRVYVTGMSNGGFLAHRIGCEAADIVAAIAPVAGVLGVNEGDCSPARPLPVMQVHGTRDFIVPFTGNVFLRYPSVEDTIAFWRGANTCAAESRVTYDEGDTECEIWDSCSGMGEVTLCTVSGGGHDWPLGGSSINATDAIWDFFQRHSL